jgi:hypothetical protein
MLAFDETDRCTCDGYWTNLYSGIVFANKDGDSGSIPRDIYEDDPDYLKRSAYHCEVIPLFYSFMELEEKERSLAKLGVCSKDPRMKSISKARSKLILDLMHVHWLTLQGY